MIKSSPVDPSKSVYEAKKLWRQELSLRCKELDSWIPRKAAAELSKRALLIPEIATAKGLLVCLSFGGEIDTWSLVTQLLEAGKKVYVPRTRQGKKLSVHPYPCQLTTTSFGLKQPVRQAPHLGKEEIDEMLDVALLLGLGFDRRGIRLGYGAGYFDRFLSNRSFPAIGLAYSAQLVDHLPNEAHDIPMSVVVTEQEVCRPS